MHRFEYSVTTKASPALAWDVYSNWKLWPKFADVYGTLSWSEGQPWEVGSRMEIEIVRPTKTVIDHLVICCEPARELGWIDRTHSITISQWVEFREQPSGGTLVHTWGEIAPCGVMCAGNTVERLVAVFTETWYENFRMFCDELAEKVRASV